MVRITERFGLGRRRLALMAGFASLSMLALAGCSNGGAPASVDASAPADFQGAPTGRVDSQPLPAAGGPTQQNGAQIGTGPTHVALILPLTQNGAPSPVGAALRNAASLALDESSTHDVSLIVSDDQSTPDGARAAAQAATSQGVKLIIGPLFAPSVRETAQVAQAANIPVIAFSTDASVATQGVYLLSFLVETYVDRIVDYAAAHGKKSFAALIPNGDYGRVAEAEFVQETSRLGVRVEGIEHYDPGQSGPAAAKIGAEASRIDALFIPEQASAMTALAAALSTNGLSSKRVQILGTGLWSDPQVLSLPALEGAWFASPDSSGFTAFASNYRSKFGSEPPRIATLAHDAAALATALAHAKGDDAYSQASLTAGSGFRGVDGIFRFKSNGLNERGLAIVEIRGGTTAVLAPAPHSFGGHTQG